MADLPPPWGQYAHLQAELGQRHQVDNQTWGKEAAMNRMLQTMVATDRPCITPDDTDRAEASARRRERRRLNLRLAYLSAPEADGSPPEEALTAKQLLKAVQAHLPSADWSLLVWIGQGYDYAELAAGLNVSQGSLRVRVSRLRGELVAIAA